MATTTASDLATHLARSRRALADPSVPDEAIAENVFMDVWTDHTVQLHTHRVRVAP